MIHEVEAKRILNKSKHPSAWFGVHYGMNVYRGCSHSCIYCDSRSECYRVDNFDTDITVKINAPELLEKELRYKRKKVTIGTGAMTDPYSHIEKEYRLTQKCLEIIARYGFPLHMGTKSNLVLRDIPILQEINKVYVNVAFTITTANDELSRKLEPGAPSSSERFEAMGILSELGIETGLLMMPLLPFIHEDEENVIKIVEKAKYYGAKFIYASFGMTLRDRQRLYYYDRLDELFPGMKEAYMKKFRNYYSCGINNYQKVKSAFIKRCKELGISTQMPSYDKKISDWQLSFLTKDSFKNH